MVDVGGGASVLVDHLVERGFLDISVVDLSQVALDQARERLGESAGLVHWLCHDVLLWAPERRYQVWHDRAVFHFLCDEDQRRLYLANLRSGLAPGGHVVIGTFAPDGPETCSGLPVARYGPDDLARAFGADFKVVGHRDEEHITPHAISQKFTWLAMAYRPRETSGAVGARGPERRALRRRPGDPVA